MQADLGAWAGAQAIEFRQTNSEAQLIDWVHDALDAACGIVINPDGCSFTSIAILDALKMSPGTIIELHISDIHRREEIEQRSLMSRAVTAVIAGLGTKGHAVAAQAVPELVDCASVDAVAADRQPARRRRAKLLAHEAHDHFDDAVAPRDDRG